MSKQKRKCRQYSSEYLKYGFIPSETNKRLPTCLICEKTFTNEDMKPSRMINHFKAKHHEKANKDVACFRDLKVRFEKRSTIGTLFKSYEINLRKDLLHLTKFQNSLLNMENHIQLVKLLLYQQ